jgi:thioesterase-3
MRYVTLAEGKSTNHSGAVKDFLKATSGELDVAQMNIKDRVKMLVAEFKKA